MEIKEYARWDEIAHYEYTTKLIKDGMTIADLEDASEELEAMEKCFVGKAYYDGLMTPTIMEKDTLDFKKPFGLFNGSI